MAHNVFNVPGSIHKGYSTLREAREAFESAQREGRVRAVDTGEPCSQTRVAHHAQDTTCQARLVSTSRTIEAETPHCRAPAHPAARPPALPAHPPAPKTSSSHVSRPSSRVGANVLGNWLAILHSRSPSRSERRSERAAESPKYHHTPGPTNRSGSTGTSSSSPPTLVTQFEPDLAPRSSAHERPVKSPRTSVPVLGSPVRLKSEQDLLSPLMPLSRTRDLQHPARAASLPVGAFNTAGSGRMSISKPAPLMQSASAPIIGVNRTTSSALSYAELDPPPSDPLPKRPSPHSTSSSYQTASDSRTGSSDSSFNIPTGVTIVGNLPSPSSSYGRSTSSLRSSELIKYSRVKNRKMRDVEVQTDPQPRPPGPRVPRSEDCDHRDVCTNCRKPVTPLPPQAVNISRSISGDTVPATPVLPERPMTQSVPDISNALGLSQSMSLTNVAIDPVSTLR